jgi:hypothetical protein
MGDIVPVDVRVELTDIGYTLGSPNNGEEIQ